MADYIAALKSDLAEQFKGKARIEGLLEAVGTELQAVFAFYEQLLNERSVLTAVGAQLDGIGDIVDLSRRAAGILSGDVDGTLPMEDETYRKYLLFKILLNTCDCTYYDVMEGLAMFWDGPFYYAESQDQPATMILDTGELAGTTDLATLLTMPVIRAAGVKLRMYIRTRTEIETEVTAHYGAGVCAWSAAELPVTNTGTVLGAFTLGESTLG